jgi:hypothetical protein
MLTAGHQQDEPIPNSLFYFSHLHLHLPSGYFPSVFLITFSFLAYFPYFLKHESRLTKSPVFLLSICYVCSPPPASTFEFLNQSLWNLVCTSWLLSHSQQSMCLYVYTHLVARPQIGKNVRIVWRVIFVRCVSYERRVCGPVCVSPFFAIQVLANHVPTAMKSCWRCRCQWVLLYEGKIAYYFVISFIFCILLWYKFEMWRAVGTIIK